jgi:hypothetical protein
LAHNEVSFRCVSIFYGNNITGQAAFVNEKIQEVRSFISGGRKQKRAWLFGGLWRKENKRGFGFLGRFFWEK